MSTTKHEINNIASITPRSCTGSVIQSRFEAVLEDPHRSFSVGLLQLHRMSAILWKMNIRTHRLRSIRVFRYEGFSFLRQADTTGTATSAAVSKTTTAESTGSTILSAAERLIDEAHKTSGRKRRRRLYDPRPRKQSLDGRNKTKKASTKATTNNEDEEKTDDNGLFTGLPKPPVHDTRTVMDLVFPNPYKDEPLPTNGKRWPNNLSEWRTAFSKVWALYRWTWRGFFTSRGFLVEDELDRKTGDVVPIADTTTTGPSQTDEIINNLHKNTKFVKEEAMNLRETVQKTTGIESREDIRRWVAEGMKLFSECVQEFMAGYRKGRDDEVEKMLTEYFQNLEDKANAPKRRRIKVRIRNRMKRRINQRYLRKFR